MPLAIFTQRHFLFLCPMSASASQPYQPPVFSADLVNALPDGDIFLGRFGLEKENIRVTDDGRIATTPHPPLFGNKQCNPYITTDFSESQIELITPHKSSIDEALGWMETLHDEVALHLADPDNNDNHTPEYLWPQSSPPKLPDSDKDIPIAQFGCCGEEQDAYRHYLAEIYGRKKQLFCGIHFNFSFNERTIQHLFKQAQQKSSGKTSSSDFKPFREDIYLRTTRNFKRYRWFLIALLGNSPEVHQSYTRDCLENTPKQDKNTIHHDQAVSIRNGICGYRNKQDLQLDYSSVVAFKRSMNQRIEQGVVQSDRENYASVRLKFLPNSENSPNSSETSNHISHLEIRMLDLNPFVKHGIELHHLQIIHQFLIFCLLTPESSALDEKQQMRGFENQERAATYGLSPDATIIDDNDEEVPMQQAIEAMFAAIESSITPYLPAHYNDSLDLLKKLVSSPTSRPGYQNLQASHSSSYISWSINQAKKFLKESKLSTFTFHGLEDMELSTQLILRRSLKRGISIDIMDRKENFVKLTYRGQSEYIQQATRTSLDNYASVLAMENKLVTKKILRSAGISTPAGREFHDVSKACDAFIDFQNQSTVIKPKSTNFGLGISILKKNQSREHFEQAVEMAFRHDSSILIESFVSGKEYRFFIIRDEVVGILHRVPANVTGDGVSTISELVQKKNNHPLRGRQYRKPLEKLSLGEPEALFLATQNLDFTSIPQNGEVVYLRENSNISTGGDSIDYSDTIPDAYRKIAIEAASALGVQITGLDMMIDDISAEPTPENYSIIELNFNPAIHIHCFPYQGENRHLDTKILDALFGQQTIMQSCCSSHVS